MNKKEKDNRKTELEYVLHLINTVWSPFVERINKADWIKTKDETMMCVQREVINEIRTIIDKSMESYSDALEKEGEQ